MSTDDSTPDAGRHPATATEQAVFLTAVVNHLLTYPALPPVNVTMRGPTHPPELYVLDQPGQRDTAPAGLADWAASLRVAQLHARPVEGWHAVGFTARIGHGGAAEVWTKVTGLQPGVHALAVAELIALTLGRWQHIAAASGQPDRWRRRLPDNGWLAVHRPRGSRYWQWEHYEPGSRSASRTVGGFDLPRPARDAADAAMGDTPGGAR